MWAEPLSFLSPVRPRPRTIPVALINDSMKARLHAIDKRVQHVHLLVLAVAVTMVTDTSGAYVEQLCPLEGVLHPDL